MEPGYDMGYLVGRFLGIVLVGALYFLPAYLGRKKRQFLPIFLVDLLLGWTVLGWIAALIWAVSAEKAPAAAVPAAPRAVGDELIKLQTLRTQGALTEEEYQREKARILQQPL